MTDEFRAAVEAYLSPYRNQFNYENMLHGHLDTGRFDIWAGMANTYLPVAGGTVLSNGCGSGGDLMAFLRLNAARIHGTEVDAGLVKLAQRRFAGLEKGERVAVTKYDGKTLPFSEDTFDIVFSMHVIEHTGDFKRYLAECVRVIKPGGILFLDIPNRYFPIEQHTLLPAIHFFGRKARNIAIRITLRLSKFLLSDDTRFRLRSLIDFDFPSPKQIMDEVKQIGVRFRLDLVDALYFAADDSKRAAEMRYTNDTANYLSRKSRAYRTFRIVIRKTQ